MKKILLQLRHKAELVLASSTATKNRSLPFQLGVAAICIIDVLVIAFCMIKIVK